MYIKQVIYYWFSFPTGSVVDPDPYSFGPPGSVSVIICMDLSINNKKIRKIFISTIFLLPFDILSLKIDVNA
jgi:hypothetical protein